MKTRIPERLLAALLALAVVLATTFRLEAVAFGAPAAAGDGRWMAQAVADQPVRAEISRGLRGGKTSVPAPAPPPGLAPRRGERPPLSPAAAVVPASAEAPLLANAHDRPSPTGPPRLG